MPAKSAIVRRLSFTALSIGLGGIMNPGIASADSGVEWGKRALKIQNQIDFNTPFHNTFWVGTHNSYNARMWGYWVDPNQKRKPQDQLESGAIELTYDVYWSAGQMKLCHGSCGAGDKTFRDGLDEIRDFIAEHPETVIMLKLEVTGSAIDGNWSKLENQLEGAIGKRIYTPVHAGLTTGCKTLDPSIMTKRTILAKGKNLIVIVTPEGSHGCPSDGGWNNLVFTGFKVKDSSTNAYDTTYKFNRPKDSAECLTKKEDNKLDMLRAHDGRTWKAMGSGDDTNVLTPSSYKGYMHSGLNIFELFNFNGDSAETNFPFLKPQDLVWSWKESEPSGDGDCAVVSSDSFGGEARFNDTSCTAMHYFACVTPTKTWKIAQEQGTFSQGHSICARYGGTFATPVNPYEHEKLRTAVNAMAPGSEYWVNYQDLRLEGEWVANDTNYTPYQYTKVASVGGDGGSSFSDYAEMSVDVHRGVPRRVIKVMLRGGARVDMVGLAYSSSATVLEHGGSGGTYKEMTIAENEYISHYATCADYKDGTKRVFYLALWKNNGQYISGGTWVDNEHCSGKIAVPAGQTLFGFHGRAGESIDALGFYFRN